MSARDSLIVEPEWLVKNLKTPGVSIIDASWYLPVHKRDARAEYDAAHIPGAVFFDQDVVVDPTSDLPHTVPAPALFEQHVSAMGISRDDTIIVYDGPGFFSAPRVWWLFRLMGASDVRVLNGGFDTWKRDGHIVTDAPTKTAPTAFVPKPHMDQLASFDTVLDIAIKGGAQIADARPAGRFEGTDPEPRPGMRSGHMPRARNVPYSILSENGRLKDNDALRTAFVEAGIDPEKPVITTCGSGVTAAVLAMGLTALGNDAVQLYDGSWSEWGARQDTPIETGPAQ